MAAMKTARQRAAADRPGSTRAVASSSGGAGGVGPAFGPDGPARGPVVRATPDGKPRARVRSAACRPLVLMAVLLLVFAGTVRAQNQALVSVRRTNRRI